MKIKICFVLKLTSSAPPILVPIFGGRRFLTKSIRFEKSYNIDFDKAKIKNGFDINVGASTT